jgi:hypothetical protein
MEVKQISHPAHIPAFGRSGVFFEPNQLERRRTIFLNQLGIFGWSELDKYLVLASLLVGDPLLLIGSHGCAKTHLAAKLTEVLGPLLSPREQTATLAEFLAKFAELLMRESKGAAWRPGLGLPTCIRWSSLKRPSRWSHLGKSISPFTSRRFCNQEA